MPANAAPAVHSSVPSGRAGASDDDEEPTKKRLRVSRACDPCRRRKERCDGGQPACQRCSGAARPCSYIPYRKRGLRTGYVRGLEILLGLMTHACDGAEDLMLSVLQRSSEEAHPRTCDRSQRHIQAAAASSLLEAWRKSTVLEDLQTALDSPESVQDEELYMQGLDGKLTLAFNALRLSPSEVEAVADAELDNGLRDLQSPRPVPVPEHDPEPAIPIQQEDFIQDTMTVPIVPDIPMWSDQKLPENWSYLIDVYITNTHSWLPIIQKHTLLRSASLLASSENTKPSRTPSRGEIASLWAVFAHSSHQLEALKDAANPVAGPTSPTQPQQLRSIHERAKHLATKDEDWYELGHVHAHLVLALLEMCRDSYGNAWLWVGKAVYTAGILGIIPSHTTSQETQALNDEQRRIFLGCFVLDTVLATKLGLRSYLTPSDVSRAGDISDDGLEEWESWRPLPYQASTASLFSGPGRLLSTFNCFCYIMATLNSLNNRQQVYRENFVRRLSTWADFMEPREPALWSNDPPHLVNVRIAAATAYSCFQIHSPTALETETGTTPFNSIQASLSANIKLITSTPANACTFDSLGLPPTIHVFLSIIRKSSALAVQRSAHQPEPHKITASLPPILSHPQCPVAEQSYEQQPTPISTRGGLSRSSAIDQPVPPLVPVPTPPPSDRANDHQLAAVQSDATNTDGLFNQLSSLDSSDWPTLSGDFMEHLGFSRDGSLIDFQNLLAPP